MPLDKIIPASEPFAGGNAIGNQSRRIPDTRDMPQGDGTNLEQKAQMPICPADDDISCRVPMDRIR